MEECQSLVGKGNLLVKALSLSFRTVGEFNFLKLHILVGAMKILHTVILVCLFDEVGEIGSLL